MLDCSWTYFRILRATGVFLLRAPSFHLNAWRKLSWELIILSITKVWEAAVLMSVKTRQTSWKKSEAAAVTFDKFTNKPFLTCKAKLPCKTSQMKEVAMIYRIWNPRKMFCGRRLHPPNYVIFWIWERDFKMCMRSLINCYIYLTLRPGCSAASRARRSCKSWQGLEEPLYFMTLEI